MQATTVDHIQKNLLNWKSSELWILSLVKGKDGAAYLWQANQVQEFQNLCQDLPQFKSRYMPFFRDYMLQELEQLHKEISKVMTNENSSTCKSKKIMISNCLLLQSYVRSKLPHLPALACTCLHLPALACT